MVYRVLLSYVRGLRGVLLMCLVFLCVYIYAVSRQDRNTHRKVMRTDLDLIENKIHRIEADLKRNHQTIALIKDAVRDLTNGDMDALKQLQDALASFDQSQSHNGGNVQAGVPHHPKFPPPSSRNGTYTSKTKNERVIADEQICAINQHQKTKTDIQMYDVYDELAFDDKDGGVWKQGFDIKYDTSQWTADNKLQVFVIPHSHCDPGWLKTFERYYTDQTRHILNNMVEKLEQYPGMRFIYAEMSFFNLWWNEVSTSVQEKVRKLLREGRLEIVSGGWVMPDEANSHYYSVVDQLLEGNQWLHNHMNYTPTSNWAIDPFGHSPTMPYLWHAAGTENMLIQRTHYEVKKYLAKRKQLEFVWRQNWDTTGSSDIFTHMMPFYSYDVPHTCGPDPKICCQFDFKRLPGGGIKCPWNISPVPISTSNVAERANTILDQYRKKATMYKNNVVLIPLGDDFRYHQREEWDWQYQNYKQLMDYINGRPELNAQVQFGTLTDYFRALRHRASTDPGALTPPGYPTLAGDFFSYADREDHYWTGYFTSRPFYKGLDRVLETHLRSAEILYSLALIQSRQFTNAGSLVNDCASKLTTARRALGLFQHHDGITGTSKDPVVIDYGNKLLDGLKSSQNVIRKTAEYLLDADKQNYQFSANRYIFDVDEIRENHDSLPQRKLIQVTSNPRSVVLYNSLTHDREGVFSLLVDSPSVLVQDVHGNVLPIQIDPIWEKHDHYSDFNYKLLFVASIPALSLYTITLTSVSLDSLPSGVISTIELYNAPEIQQQGHFQVVHPTESIFTIDSSDIKATFSTSTGMLQSIFHKQSAAKLNTEIEFLYYGTTNKKDKSGAYLFMPNGPAFTLPYASPLIRVVRGLLSAQVTVYLPVLQHTVTLHNSPGVDGLALNIENLVDISSTMNKELSMRIKTSVANSGGEYFTDLNAFQMQKRRTLSKIPLQGNFYPMTSMAYLEDLTWRFNLLTAQSLGVAGLQNGWLEVIQDRRLLQDDNRGVGQGVKDNKQTPNRFSLLVERHGGSQSRGPKKPVGYPSLQAHIAQQQLIHNIHPLPISDMTRTGNMLVQYTALNQQLPCDTYLLNFRTLPQPETGDVKFTPRKELGLMLHRLGVDCTLPVKGLTCPVDNAQLTLGSIFSDSSIHLAEERSLTLLHKHATLSENEPLNIPPMEIKTYQLTFT